MERMVLEYDCKYLLKGGYGKMKYFPTRFVNFTRQRGSMFPCRFGSGIL